MGAINPRNKQAERALADALQTRMAARYERRLRSEIAKTLRQVADEYEKRGELAIPLAVQEHSKKISDALAADYRATALFFGERVLGEAKSRGLVLETKDEETPKALLKRSIELFIGEWLASKITRINTTTEDQIRTIVRNGIEQGFGTDKIAREIRNFAPSIARTRASIIARTETHAAANFGAQEAAQLTGLELRREWVSVEDDRTRPDHADANGQVVGMNEPFEVEGEQLMYPGDPSGSAGNIINCRCAVVFVFD